MALLVALLVIIRPPQHTHTHTTQDSGEVPLSSVEELRISVTDVNDLDPIFTRNVYAIDVHENLTFVS